MKVFVFKRSISDSVADQRLQYPKEVAYCGYLEVDNPFEVDLWHLCNWDCWSSDSKPKECEHLLIGYCSSDVAYCINGEWYSHGMDKFKNFYHCYAEMTGHTWGKYFSSLWRTGSGFPARYIKNPSLIQIVTPGNVNNFIH